MAISGTTFTVTPTSTSNYTTGRVVWEYTQDEDNNQSTITATLQFKNSGVATTITQVPSFYITIDGQQSDPLPQGRYSISSSWVTVLTYTATVTHANDGTKSLVIEAGGGLSQTSGLPNSYGTSGEVSLLTIPRGSIIASITQSSNDPIRIGQAMTITLTDPTGGLNYHTLTYSFSGKTTITGTIPNATLAQGTTFYFKPSYATFGPAIPDRVTGNLSITVTSYTSSAGTTQRGEPDTKTITVAFPATNSTRPTAGSFTVEDTVKAQGTQSKIAEVIGAYVQGASKPKFTTSPATAKYGATIKSYQFQFENSTMTAYHSDSAESYSRTFGVITSNTNQTATLLITDSRGITRSADLSVEILPYVTPSITKQSVKRASSPVTTINVKSSAKVISLKRASAPNTELNEIHVYAAYKLQSSSIFLNEEELTYRTSDPVAADGYLTVTDATRSVVNTNSSSSYEFRITVKDKVASYSQVYKVGTSEVGLHIGPSWAGVGKIRERGTLDVGGSIMANPSIVVSDAAKTEVSDGLRGVLLSHLGRIYIQGDSSNAPQINFYGKSGSTTRTASIEENTNGVLTFNADIKAATGNTVKAENLPDISDEYLSSTGTKSFTLALRRTYMLICTRHGGTMDTSDVRIIATGASGVNTNAPITTASFVTVSTSGTTLYVTTSETYVRVALIDLGSYL